MKYDGYQRALSSMVYKLFNKKSATFVYKSARDTSFIYTGT